MTTIEINEFKANFDKKLILLCESGSETYGFKSETSDTDVRGIFVEDTVNLLSMKPPKDICQGFSEDRMIDWQIFELKKFLGLVVKPNFNILEWIYTPYQYMSIPPELIAIADLSLSRGLGDHARGWAYSIYKMDWQSPKKCIYAIRPLMAYINLCQTGEFESNITRLAGAFNVTNHVDLLIDLYKTNHRASEIVRAKTLKIYDELVAESFKVEIDSWLPIRPPREAFDMADKFLIKNRMLDL